MKILLISPEGACPENCSPLGEIFWRFKLGYQAAGHEVLSIVPLHSRLYTSLENLKEVFSGEDPHTGRSFRVFQKEGDQVFLISQPDFFNRNGIYDENGIIFTDNHLRFAFFASAALYFAHSQNFIPHKIHAHEWAGALACVFAKNQYVAQFPKSFVQLTLHNLKYDYCILEEQIHEAGLNPELFKFEGYEFWGKASLIKAGVLAADEVVLTSSHYMHQILNSHSSRGFSGFLEEHVSKIRGIQTAIDYEIWNPEQPVPGLVPYSNKNFLINKPKNRALFLNKLACACQDGVVLGARVNGISGEMARVLATILSNLLTFDLRLVLMISQSHEKFEYFLRVAEMNPDRLLIFSADSEADLKLFFSGIDASLIWMNEEPSGALLLKSLAMGVPPLVCQGMPGIDPLIDLNADYAKANCILGDNHHPDQMLRVIREFCETKATDPDQWNLLVKNALGVRVKWSQVVKDYNQNI
jgi:starch synthase